jgi:hypothetical protein
VLLEFVFIRLMHPFASIFQLSEQNNADEQTRVNVSAAASITFRMGFDFQVYFVMNSF